MSVPPVKLDKVQQGGSLMQFSIEKKEQMWNYQNILLKYYKLMSYK